MVGGDTACAAADHGGAGFIGGRQSAGTVYNFELCCLVPLYGRMEDEHPERAELSVYPVPGYVCILSGGEDVEVGATGVLCWDLYDRFAADTAEYAGVLFAGDIFIEEL